MKKVLILSYHFPPSSKVGGRRWVKLSKYLSRMGVEVHVIAIKIDSNTSINLWGEDAEEVNNIYYIKGDPSPYFRRNMVPKSIIGKFRYHISFRWYQFKTRFIRGDYQDVSLKYKKRITSLSLEIINKYKIDNLICTGGPFRMLQFGLLVKKKLPDLNFIIDYRDYWTDSVSTNNISKERFLEEKNIEAEVVMKANYIFAVNMLILEKLTRDYALQKNKLILLPHAYDHDDFEFTFKNRMGKAPKSDKIEFCYAGMLYPKMELTMHKLSALLQNAKKKRLNWEVHFFSFSESYKEIFSEYGVLGMIKYKKLLKPTELFKEMSNYDVILQLRANEVDERNFKSSKFYEILYLKKPIMYIGPPKSTLGDYYEKNGIGTALYIDSPMQKGLDFINKMDEVRIKENFDSLDYEGNNFCCQASYIDGYLR